MAITGVNTYQDFGFTGGVQSFTAPMNGTYKLEAWGAQGGSVENMPAGTNYGGLGGYTSGIKVLTKGQILYICVGSQGSRIQEWTTVTAGYNGGGDAGPLGSDGGVGAGGGGATHIATINRGVLTNYASYTGDFCIIAGGGGGSQSGRKVCSNGGTGGGDNGGDGSNNTYNWPGTGGTQTGTGRDILYGGYAGGFGYGGIGKHYAGGGGGGLYGGRGGAQSGGGGGGSGYIGTVKDGFTDNGIRTGNGYARITLAKGASQLYYKDTLVETLHFNGALVDMVIYNGTTVMG